MNILSKDDLIVANDLIKEIKSFEKEFKVISNETIKQYSLRKFPNNILSMLNVKINPSAFDKWPEIDKLWSVYLSIIMCYLDFNFSNVLDKSRVEAILSYVWNECEKQQVEYVSLIEHLKREYKVNNRLELGNSFFVATYKSSVKLSQALNSLQVFTYYRITLTTKIFDLPGKLVFKD